MVKVLTSNAYKKIYIVTMYFWYNFFVFGKWTTYNEHNIDTSRKKPKKIFKYICILIAQKELKYFENVMMYYRECEYKYLVQISSIYGYPFFE